MVLVGYRASLNLDFIPGRGFIDSVLHCQVYVHDMVCLRGPHNLLSGENLADLSLPCIKNILMGNGLSRPPYMTFIQLFHLLQSLNTILNLFMFFT